MKYALLIYGPAEDGPSPEEQAAAHPRWMTYTQELLDAGVHAGGAALQPIDTATTLRERDGQRVVTDGPFAETKDLLGGFYIVDVPDLDAALDWAARLPNMRYWSVEVRPLLELDDAPAAA